MRIVPSLFFAALLLLHAGWAAAQDAAMDENARQEGQGTAEATFAGGCFWCVEADFEKLDGVREAVSGYAGGEEPDPSYDQVASGNTGHREAVRVLYDPDTISYADLVDHFWHTVDPTDPGGSFVDRGHQYTSAIFYHDEEQKRIAEESRRVL
ncbi:MAG: peptide-methionine (S)-S-oxide reductase MsrA, partial [Oceanidesulfovibrio sp.]